MDADRDGAPSAVRVELLGPVRIRFGDAVVAPGPPKHRALLALLAVDAGRVVSTDTILTSVWDPDESRTGSLHVAVSRLRRLLAEVPDGPRILTRAPGYVLTPEGWELDTKLFAAGLDEARALVAADRFTEARRAVEDALALWRGDALADVAGEFARAEADRLHRHRASVVQLGVEISLALGEHVALTGTLPPLVAGEPLDEDLRAALVLALYRSGRQADAISAYLDGRRALADELGVQPGPRLEQLYLRILDHDPSLLFTPEPVAPPGPPSVRPLPTGFVAREVEIAALEPVALGREPAAVVLGEAGVGKTALVERLVASAGDGTLVVEGRHQAEQAGAAGWAWTPVVRGLERALAGRDAGDAGDDGAEPHRRVLGLLARVCADRRVLLVLEDLQWADDESLTLMAAVVEATATLDLHVLLTVRTASPAARPPAEVVDLVSSRADVRVVDLAPFDAAETAAYLEAVDPGRTADAARLHALTGGNAYFIEELVRSGFLEDPSATVPGHVQTVVMRRVTGLDADAHRVVLTAAVLGQEVDLVDLAAVLGRAPRDLVDPLDEAIASGILAEPDSIEVHRFEHGIAREAIVASLGPMTLATMHAGAARALEDAAGHRGDPATIAHHWMEAGPFADAERAVAAIVASTGVRGRARGLADAERRLRSGLDLVPALPASVRTAGEVALRQNLASVLTLARGFGDPAVATERARLSDLTADDAGDHLGERWGEWSIALSTSRFADARAAAERIRPGAVTPGSLPGAASRLARGIVDWHLGDHAAAEDDLRAALDWLLDHPDDQGEDVITPHALPLAAVWSSVVSAHLGHDERSEAASMVALHSPLTTEHPFTRAYVHTGEALRQAVLRDPRQARHHSDLAIEVAESIGFAQLGAGARMTRGWGRALADGETEEGLADLAAAHAALRLGDAPPPIGHVVHTLTAEVLLAADRRDAAVRAVRTALEESDALGERAFRDRLDALAADLGVDVSGA